MALEPGIRFGNYEIGDPIGAGGMGEVYRATDTTLERAVAIKVLPASFAEDAVRIERFEREAKTLAALNHPNIAQIHGLEKTDGTTALVMELVEGPTLADRIAEGPIPADEALGIAMQIAEALEAAHGQQIVHRDLKPANVMVRDDGTVKVLDFGIAKAFDIQASSGPGAPAMTTPAVTQTGIILGTAAYMSPEQARGKFVDDRTDVWAFGCLLYEMLTGQPAFAGEDVAITLARILANETDMKSLPAAISPAVRQTIELCLQKDPNKRIADIRDVKLSLEGAFDTIAAQGGAVMTIRQPMWRRALLVVAPVLAALVAGFAIWTSMQPDPEGIRRFDYDLPSGQRFRELGFRVIAISPDGSSFVYNTTQGLFLRTMEQLEARLIPGTEPASVSLAFSPDGRAVAFWGTTGEVKRISTTGGAAVVIAENVEPPLGMTWEANGTLLIGQAAGIFQVSTNGGVLEQVIPAQGEVPFGATLLPDGETVLLTSTTTDNWDTAQILAHSLSTGERTVVLNGGSDARYLPTGHLVYALGSGLYAVAFDPDSLTVSGDVVPLVQGVTRPNPAVTGTAQYSVADNGTLIYVRGGTTAQANMLVWVDRDGRELPLTAEPRNYLYPRISPDGTRIALDVRDQELDIWIWDIMREALTRLTFDSGQDEFPVWSPDGQRIAFSSTRDSGSSFETSLFLQAADGTGAVERLADSPGQIFPTGFVADESELIVYGAAESNINDDIGRISLPDGETESLLNSVFGETNPELSPDGNWLAYTSNESGREEIYVRPFPDIEAGRWQVSTGGGTQPLWARNGQELFYRSGTEVMAVSTQPGPAFVAGNPRPLFEDNYILGPGGRNFDVSPDGEAFLMIRSLEDATIAPQIIIVENWFEELERLVPAE
ncbi:MAG: protein kinase [Gammaproteobacteria bacterium]|nr:protein kinase [Gammaproteobacteria bacterium]